MQVENEIAVANLKQDLEDKNKLINSLTKEIQELQKYKTNADGKLVDEIREMAIILEEFDAKYSDLENKFEQQVKENAE